MVVEQEDQGVEIEADVGVEHWKSLGLWNTVLKIIRTLTSWIVLKCCLSPDPNPEWTRFHTSAFLSSGAA